MRSPPPGAPDKTPYASRLAEETLRRRLRTGALSGATLTPLLCIVATGFVGFYPWPVVYQALVDWHVLVYVGFANLLAQRGARSVTESIVQFPTSSGDVESPARYFVRLQRALLAAVLLLSAGGILTTNTAIQAWAVADPTVPGGVIFMAGLAPAAMMAVCPLQLYTAHAVTQYLSSRESRVIAGPLRHWVVQAGVAMSLLGATLFLMRHANIAGEFSWVTAGLGGLVAASVAASAWLGRGSPRELGGVLAQAMVRRQESQLESFFSQSLDGCFLMMLEVPIEWNDATDKEKALDWVFARQRMTKVNAAMAAQYGATPEEMIGLTPDDLMAHDIAYGKRLWGRLFDDGRLAIETDERMPYGTPVQIQGEYVCLRDDQGRITGHFGIQRDVTEQLRVQAELQRNERRLADAQRIAGIGSWELDLREDRLTWSDEIFQLFELDRSKFGASYEAFLEAIHPDDREAVNAAYRASLETHTPYAITHRLLMADGRIKWVEERCDTEFADDGTALVSRGTVQDITERRRMEGEVREARDRLQYILDASPDWIFVKDLRARLVMVNTAFASAQGLSPDQVVGRSESEFWVPGSRGGDEASGASRFGEDDRRALAGELVRNPDDRAVSPDGTHRVFDTYRGPTYGPDGSITGVFAYARDITDRVRAEDQTRRALDEKEVLLREIHHRVKNNLQIVSSLIRFQSKKVAGPEAVEVFQQAQERLRSMMLIHEKLYQSRDLGRVDFADYVRTLLGQMMSSHLYEDRHIEYNVDAAPVQLPIAIALPAGMILVELVTNVMKYGLLASGPGTFEVRVVHEGDLVHLTVADQGVGLPADFDPNRPPTFGWQLIRALTAQLGGAITLGEGPGTQATVSFDCRPAPAREVAFT